MVARPDLKSLFADERGATMVVYAVVAGMVSMGALSAFGSYDAEVADLAIAVSDAARAFFGG